MIFSWEVLKISQTANCSSSNDYPTPDFGYYLGCFIDG